MTGEPISGRNLQHWTRRKPCSIFYMISAVSEVSACMVCGCFDPNLIMTACSINSWL